MFTKKKAKKKAAAAETVSAPVSAPSEEIRLLRSNNELLTSIDESLRQLTACIQQQKDPETGEPCKTWLKTREFG